MMSSNKGSYSRILTATLAGAAAFALTLSLANPAAAQRGGGGFGQRGGGQGGPGGGRPGQGMRRPSPTLATVPVTAMTPYFGLTDDQAKKIEEIQKNARPDFQAMASRFQDIQSQIGANPTAADRERMRAQFQAAAQDIQAQRSKMQQDQEKAVKEIELVLTPEQRPAIASFLRDVELLQQVGLPLELIKPLDLNGPQKRKLQNIAQQQEEERGQKMQQMFQQFRQQAQAGGGAGGNAGGNAGTPPDPQQRQQQMQAGMQQFQTAMKEDQKQLREKVFAVLTTDQRALVEKWEKDHPDAQRRGFGGFVGPGGPGGGAGFGGFGGPGGAAGGNRGGGANGGG